MADREEKHLTPVWIVYVDGKRLDTEHEGALQRIHMDDVLNDVGACILEFDSSAVKIAEKGTFTLDSVVSVHMGYKDDCEQVFSGEVTDFEVQCNEYGHVQLLVTCRNCLYKMQNAHKSTSFESKRLSDILRGIVDSYSLQSEIDDFGATKDYQVELCATDFDFLIESARKYGKTVYAYESKVYVKNEVTVRDDDIILEWGKSLISFIAQEHLKGQLSSCVFTGWDENNCEAINGNASLKEIPVKVGGSKSWEDNSNGAGGKWTSTFVEENLHDNDDAKERAIGKLTESSFAYQTGMAKCEGDYRIHPGMRVNIKYVGKKFSGEYIADRVEHDLTVGGAFITRLHLKRNFCETSIHKEASAIDSEMASNQSANAREENALAASAGESQAENQGNSESKSSEKNPQITNPHWEDADGKAITKALVGDEVYLCAEVTDIANGTTAKIKIVEKDADGNDDDLTVLTDKVHDGKIRCDWKVVYMEDDDDADSEQEKKEKGYTLPEYAFTVECDGAESEESEQLDVRGQAKVYIIDKVSREKLSNKIVHIFKNAKEIYTGKTDNNGFFYIKDVDIGYYDIEVE